MVPVTFSETFTAGPRTGQTATVDALPQLTGMISQDGKTLIAADTEPAVETHRYSNGDVWPEICHRSRVFIRIRTDGGTARAVLLNRTIRSAVARRPIVSGNDG